jgi:DNA polymerase III epsilon subunit-like protein
MKKTNWILLDIETTGLTGQIFVVELAAQRMRGWEPYGEPFRKLVNQNQDIPGEAARVHGYTREILERDGEPPLEVYREFAEYVGNLPLVSFNLEYDLEEVLKPEWKRLRVTPIGKEGFCALRLAQRLLDPVPAGNCKLQTLRQYYHLSQRGAHTALGDVETVVDLVCLVLRPIAERRGLDTWEKLVAYTSEEWYPSRIGFGKFKGHLVSEAKRNPKIRRWIEGLAGSSNPRSARMGRRYLRELVRGIEPKVDLSMFPAWAAPSVDEAEAFMPPGVKPGLIFYVNPELEELRRLVAGARAYLAALEVEHAREKSKLDALSATLFRRLRTHYEKRDRLRLVVDYRRKYLESLLRGSDDEAERLEDDYEKARTQTEQDYQQTTEAVANKKQLTSEEEEELGNLWKKLVKLYHPDRFVNEPDKLETYNKLTSAINEAKDKGDIATLREIANDPEGFIMRQGWQSLDFSEEKEIQQLRSLYETLQLEIFNVMEALNQLKESPDFELCLLSVRSPGMLGEIIAERSKLLEKETAELETQADKLAHEIAELTGEKPSRFR